jgi:hypothetical protein
MSREPVTAIGRASQVRFSLYRTCRCRGSPGGRFGWSKSSAGLRDIPIRSITPIERLLSGTVNAFQRMGARESHAFRKRAEALPAKSAAGDFLQSEK